MASNTSIKSILTTLNSLISNGSSISSAANKFVQSNKDAQQSAQFGDLLQGLVSKTAVKKETSIKLNTSSTKDTPKNDVQDKNDRNTRVATNQKQDVTDKPVQNNSVKDNPEPQVCNTSKTTDTKSVADTKVEASTTDNQVAQDETSSETTEVTPEMLVAFLHQLQQLLETQVKAVDTTSTTTDSTENTDVSAEKVEVAPESIGQLSQKVLDLLEKLKNNSADVKQVLSENTGKNESISDDMQKQIAALLDKIKDVVSPEDLNRPIKIEVQQNNGAATEDLLNKIKLTLDNNKEKDQSAELKPLTADTTETSLVQQTTVKTINHSSTPDQFQQETSKNDADDSSESLFSESLSASALDGGKFDVSPVLSENNGIQNIEAVRNTIVTGVKNNHQQINLQLEPANLGQLRVQISRQVQQGEAVVSARLITSNLDAKDAIQNQIQSLTRALESQGIKVGKIEVIDSGKHQETVLNQMQQIFNSDNKVSSSNESQESSNQNAQNGQQGQDGFTQNFSQYQQAFQEQQQHQQVLREYEKMYASSTLNTNEVIENTPNLNSAEELSLQNASISLKV